MSGRYLAPHTRLGAIDSVAPTNKGPFQRYLELPVLVVLLTIWFLGAALLGLCALPLYLLFW